MIAVINLSVKTTPQDIVSLLIALIRYVHKFLFNVLFLALMTRLVYFLLLKLLRLAQTFILAFDL